jgi:hypothetical protein
MRGPLTFPGADGFVPASLVLLHLAVATGCHSTSFINYPQTTGSHKFIDIGGYMTKEQKHAVVIWADHPAAVATIKQLEEQNGSVILDPATIDELVNEQKTKFPDLMEEEIVLRAARLAKADSVIFAKVAVAPADGTSAYKCNVAIRAVNVEIGEVRWTGTAWYPRPVKDPEESIRVLTATAIARARCPIERGFFWYQDKGCQVR